MFPYNIIHIFTICFHRAIPQDIKQVKNNKDIDCVLQVNAVLNETRKEGALLTIQLQLDPPYIPELLFHKTEALKF